MADKSKKPLILVQKPMLRVVYALLPLVLASIYFFGWRALVVLVVVNIAGFLSEYAFARVYKTQVSSAVFVTNFLFAMSLPPTIPYWIAIVGIVFGVVFGKMVFGGFGRNVFNPAISGRAFIYVSFGAQMTAHGAWVDPLHGVLAGFAQWHADAISSATPLPQLAAGTHVPMLNLFLGNVAGSFGETSALLILLGGIYLMVRKIASYQIVLGGFIGYGVLQTILCAAGAHGAYDPLSGVLAGSFLYVALFMATDPVSAGQTTNPGRWIIGLTFGLLTSLIRTFSVWPEGATFAILIANMFAPLINHLLREAKNRAKAAAKGQTA